MKLYTLIKNSTNTSWGEIVEKARTNNNKLSNEVKKDMIQELSYLFDTVGSECAEEYFNKDKS